MLDHGTYEVDITGGGRGSSPVLGEFRKVGVLFTTFEILFFLFSHCFSPQFEDERDAEDAVKGMDGTSVF